MALLETLIAEPPPLRREESGTVRVGATRVTLDTVVFYYNRGCPPEVIVEKFPTLILDDVYGTIAYYLRHRGDVDAYLEQREREGEEIRRKIEAVNPPDPHLKERLLARQAQKRRQEGSSS